LAAALATGQPPSSQKKSRGDPIQGTLKRLEGRGSHQTSLGERNRQNSIAKARKAAQLVGGDDPAAFVRTFDASLLSAEGAGPRANERGFLRSPSLMRKHMINGVPDDHATKSIFEDPKYLANAKALILSPHVDRYPASSPERITGGFPDAEGQFPDCVAVGSDEDGYCCTGTLIAPNVVLTAGHCYPCCNEKQGGKVHFGPKAQGQGRTVKVRWAVRHPEYGLNGKHNDLTLLILEEDVTDVTPRPRATAAVLNGVKFIKAVGFGNTDFGGMSGYGTRRMANIPIADTSGPSAGQDYGCDVGWEFVAGGIGFNTDTCTGDSGGPAFITTDDTTWLLAGVTSRMTQGAQKTCGDGGIYVRVDKYADWVSATVRDARSPKQPPARPEKPLPYKKTPVKSRTPGMKHDRNQPERAVAGRYVVYVHGICPHPKGYSDDWWRALKPFVKDVVLDENRLEVLWSDLVNPQRRLRAARAAQNNEVKKRVVEQLRDRAARQRVDAAGDERGLVLNGGRSLLDEIPGLNCVDDFIIYLLDDDVRAAIKQRFTDVVGPLLRKGAEVEVISHSWGTVVAYEAMRDLEASGESFTGSVLTFFSVGSALSIGEVKSRLQDNAKDGAKPAFVKWWANLNARFDVVGGHLKNAPFAVDEEFLGLRPVGCRQFIPDPVCSHGSYFDQDNLAVNRDIFGRLIRE
jgi:hypothetical protein